LVGYKWYERKAIDTLFPFGHGLSYTQFYYSNLEVHIRDNMEVSCKFLLENTGDVVGAETAQCYVAFQNADKSEPVKTLQGFAKESIESKENMEIEIKLTPRNFSYWDIDSKSWKIKEGSYEILIGSSATTIHLRTAINLEQVQEVLDPLV